MLIGAVTYINFIKLHKRRTRFSVRPWRGTWPTSNPKVSFSNCCCKTLKAQKNIPTGMLISEESSAQINYNLYKIRTK